MIPSAPILSESTILTSARPLNNAMALEMFFQHAVNGY
jgi:hypothetical protein